MALKNGKHFVMSCHVKRTISEIQSLSSEHIFQSLNLQILKKSTVNKTTNEHMQFECEVLAN